MKPKLGIYYDAYATMTGTVFDHVSAFGLMQDFDTYFLPKQNFKPGQLDSLDLIIVHYSCRIAFPKTLPRNFISSLENFEGAKFIFIQDEYDNTESSRQAIEKIKPKIVFTCIPREFHELIYPRNRFLRTKFVQVLTGFSPSTEIWNKFGIPYPSRVIDIGYRGRTISYKYGRLGFDKRKIGEDVKSNELFSHLNLDISSHEDDRIYGDKWYTFLSKCKSVLGTESGSNLFDFDGTLEELSTNFSSFEAFEKHIEKSNPEFTFMGQISPRIFESSALKVLNILFPGTYSGIIKPWIHYVPLERDLSNVEQVLSIIENSEIATKITERAYEDLIKSGKYSKEAFLAEISEHINSNFNNFTASSSPYDLNFSKDVKVLSEIRYLKISQTNILKTFWHIIPFNVRIRIYWLINKIYNRFYK